MTKVETIINDTEDIEKIMTDETAVAESTGLNLQDGWNWLDHGTPPQVTISSKVGVVTVMDTPTSAQRPYVFVKSADGHLWLNYWDGRSWIWYNLFSPPFRTVVAGIGVVTVKDTPASAQRPYVFVLASDGHLWTMFWGGFGWNWTDLGSPSRTSIIAGIGVTTVMDTPSSAQRPYIFVQSSDGNLWLNFWNGIEWPWADLRTPGLRTIRFGIGVITVMDTPASAQRPYAFVQTIDGYLYVNWWNGSEWIWADLGTPPGRTLNRGIGVITVMDEPASPQRPYAYIQANDGLLYSRWWNGAEWKWWPADPSSSRPVNVGIGITTVMDTPTSQQRPFVFVKTTDGHLSVNWWNGSEWIWSDQGTPPSRAISAGIGAVTVMDTPASSQRPYIFVLASDGHLWANWFS